MNRSATLSTTGRSFTTGDNKMLFQKSQPANFIVSKPNNESRTATAKIKLTKPLSKRVTLHSSMTHHYDESFIRYVNGFESYFKASELRNQSSSEEAKSKSELLRNRVRYVAEVSTSMEASSGSLSDARSYSLDSPKSQKKKSLPRVSLVYDTAPHIDLLDSPKSFSETASSYYATPDQDRSFITTPSDNYSFFATASEQTSYLTAEHESLDESHTFVLDAKQFSSQETLYNDDDDIFKDDEEDDEAEDEEEDEMQDRITELVRPSSSSDVSVPFSRLNLGFGLRTRFHDEMDATNVLTSPESRESKVEAKIRRSNFVRSTCIDLEEEESGKSDASTISNSTSVLKQDAKTIESPIKDSTIKCFPT